RRASRSLRPEHASGAGAVVDEDLLPQPLAERVRNEPPHHVVAAARREWNDQPHRPCRIRLGGACRGEHERQNCDGEKESCEKWFYEKEMCHNRDGSTRLPAAKRTLNPANLSFAEIAR